MIDLYPTWTLGDLVLTEYPFAVEFGGDHGAPESVVELVASMLADGDLVQQVRHGNREITLTVIVEGATLGALAENEATLRRACSRQTTLEFQPGDVDSPASVFEVLSAEMRHARDDDNETNLLHRWELSLTCAPFARSVDPVTVEALAVPGSETLVTVDTCDLATGWSATSNGGPAPVDMAWAAGAVSVHELLNPGGQTLTLTRTGFINFTPTPYLQVEMGYRADLGSLPVTCTVGGALSGGATLSPLEQRLLSPGRFLYTFDTAGVTVESLTFTSVTSADTADLKIYNVARTDMPPNITRRQSSRIIEAGGTERTPASILVASPDDTPLGLTIVHTCPEQGMGYSPPLRRWRTYGNTVYTDNPLTVSGAYESLGPNHVVHVVPSESLPPGGYLLCARLWASSPGSAQIEVLTDTSTPDGEIVQQVARRTFVSFSAANVWQFTPIMVLTLPSARMTSGTVAVDILNLDGASINVEMDEAWLFRMDDDCALTVVDSAHPNLRLDSPNVSTGSVPMVWTGGDSEWFHPGGRLLAMGSHNLVPEGVSMFTVTANVDHPQTTATFYRRWHSNAAE